MQNFVLGSSGIFKNIKEYSKIPEIILEFSFVIIQYSRKNPEYSRILKNILKCYFRIEALIILEYCVTATCI